MGSQKPGFLPNLLALTKYCRKKTRFLGPVRQSCSLTNYPLITDENSLD